MVPSIDYRSWPLPFPPPPPPAASPLPVAAVRCASHANNPRTLPLSLIITRLIRSSRVSARVPSAARRLYRNRDISRAISRPLNSAMSMRIVRDRFHRFLATSRRRLRRVENWSVFARPSPRDLRRVAATKESSGRGRRRARVDAFVFIIIKP